MKIWENLDEKDVFFFGLFRLHLISSVVIKYGTEGCDPHGYSCSVPVSHEVSSTTFAWLRSIFGSVLHWLHQHLRLHLTHLQHLLVWLDLDWASVSWWHPRWVDVQSVLSKMIILRLWNHLLWTLWVDFITCHKPRHYSSVEKIWFTSGLWYSRTVNWLH